MSNSYTPLMQQYVDIKAQYPDTILLFQVGDFFELFWDDAKVVSAALSLTLTTSPNSECRSQCRRPRHCAWRLHGGRVAISRPPCRRGRNVSGSNETFGKSVAFNAYTDVSRDQTLNDSGGAENDIAFICCCKHLLDQIVGRRRRAGVARSGVAVDLRGQILPGARGAGGRGRVRAGRCLALCRQQRVQGRRR